MPTPSDRNRGRKDAGFTGAVAGQRRMLAIGAQLHHDDAFASMEPSLVSDGCIHQPPTEPAPPSGLQWSRRWSATDAAEIEAREPRHRRASMEPSLVSDGCH